MKEVKEAVREEYIKPRSGLIYFLATFEWSVRVYLVHEC